MGEDDERFIYIKWKCSLVFIVFLFFSWVSLSLCFWSFRTTYKESPRDFVLRLLWFLPLYIGVFLWPVTQMQYTTTTALIGSGILCLIIKSEFVVNEGTANSLFFVILGMLSLFMFELRWAVFCICFVVIIYTYLMSILFGKKKLSYVAVEFGIMASIFVFVVLTNLLQDRLLGEWEYKHIYDGERVQYVDYDALPYNDYSELYESVGWSRELMPLTRDFFLMDRSMNVEAFSRINEMRRQETTQSIISGMKDGIRRVYAYPYYNNVCLAGIIACGCLGVLFLSVQDRNVRMNIFCACSYLVMFGLGAVLIASRGRFENRIFWMLMVIFIPPMILRISNAYREKSDDDLNKKRLLLGLFLR